MPSAPGLPSRLTGFATTVSSPSMTNGHDSDSPEGVRTKEAEAFEARLLAAIPALMEHVHRSRGDACASDARTIVKVTCPNPKISEGMVIWMEGGTDPSLAFGKWHSHASLFEGSVAAGWDGIIDFAAAILGDQLVLVREIGRRKGDRLHVLDLREEDALAELLTSRFCSDVVDVFTWSGSGDRRVELTDL
jgi:hypothetical protein